MDGVELGKVEMNGMCSTRDCASKGTELLSSFEGKALADCGMGCVYCKPGTLVRFLV